jgi:synaptojanin
MLTNLGIGYERITTLFERENLGIRRWQTWQPDHSQNVSNSQELSVMAESTVPGQQRLEQASSRSSSGSSSPSTKSKANHDWVSRQLSLRRTDFVDTLDITVKIVSWNVNGKRIVEDLTSLLTENCQPEIYAIGYPSDLLANIFRLQEMDLSKSTYVSNDPTYEYEWTNAISLVLGESYEKIASHQLIGIFLVVFASKGLAPTISMVQKSYLPTGHFSLLGNKGGTAIRLQCCDTSICFVDVHLYHAPDATTRRTGDVIRILRDIVFDDADKIKAHDLVFLFGDLNYRVSTAKWRLNQVTATSEEAKDMLDNGAIDKLFIKDQLTEIMATEEAFRGFREVPLIFILSIGANQL